MQFYKNLHKYLVLDIIKYLVYTILKYSEWYYI